MPWLMLLPYIVVVDGKPGNRCYHLYYIKVADVIAILLFVADGKPHKLHVTAFEDGRCYCQGGRLNGHCRVGDW